MNRNATYSPFVLLALLLALVVRMCVWTAYLDCPDKFIQPDTRSYLDPGIQLLAQGNFPSYSRTPVYPLFLAVASKVLSPSPAILAILQIGISLITIFLTYLLCLRIFRFTTAVLVLIFMALDITSAVYANQILSETLFTFILVSCLCLLVRFCGQDRTNRDNMIGMFLVGIGFSILTMCRPIAILMFVSVAFWLYINPSIGKRRSHKFTLILCLGICSMLLPLSWTIRNHAHTGTYFFSTISSIDIYDCIAAWNVSYLDKRPFKVVQDEFRKKAEIERRNRNLNEGELADWARSEGIRILKNNPLLTLYQCVNGIIKMYIGISNTEINKLAAGLDYEKNHVKIRKIIRLLITAGCSLSLQPLRMIPAQNFLLWIAAVKLWTALYLALLYLGVFVALVQIITHRFPTEQQYVLWLMLIVVAYFTFFSLGAGANIDSRFRVPIAPALSILGAAGWIAIFDLIHSRSKNGQHMLSRM